MDLCSLFVRGSVCQIKLNPINLYIEKSRAMREEWNHLLLLAIYSHPFSLQENNVLQTIYHTKPLECFFSPGNYTARDYQPGKPSWAKFIWSFLTAYEIDNHKGWSHISNSLTLSALSGEGNRAMNALHPLQQTKRTIFYIFFYFCVFAILINCIKIRRKCWESGQR